MHPPEFDTAECISLVTLRRDGTEVATPVWFVAWQGLLCLRTAAHFGKVRRLRNNPAVRYAPCDWHGSVNGPWLQGTAELIVASDARAAVIDRLLDEKYGERRAAMSRLMVAEGMQAVFVAIRPDAASARSSPCALHEVDPGYRGF